MLQGTENNESCSLNLIMAEVIVAPDIMLHS